jgi:hypothetical protein
MVKISTMKPSRVVVGNDYYFASGVVKSRTQLERWRASGRISKQFKVGARDAQWKDVADADIARLTGQSSDEDAA